MTKRRIKHSMTQEEMIADIKRVMEIVGVTDRLPSTRDVRKYGNISEKSLKEFGYLSGISEIMGLPLYGGATWTPDKIENEIKRIIETLGLDCMPTMEQIAKHGRCSNDVIFRNGGLRKFSKVIGIPMAGEIGYKKVCQQCGKEFRTQKTGTLYCSSKCKQEAKKERDGQKTDDTTSKKLAKAGRAFRIEGAMRKQGKRYADYQKQKTLEMVGGIDVSKYEGLR